MKGGLGDTGVRTRVGRKGVMRIRVMKTKEEV